MRCTDHPAPLGFYCGLSGFGYVPTALWNDARVAEEAPLLRVQSCKRLVSSNLTHSLHNQIAIVESPRCLEVRAIERFPIVVLGRTRPGRIDMWCMSLLTIVTPCQQGVDPAKGLTFWNQRDIVSAQKRIIGRVRVYILIETNRCPFADISIRSLIDTMVSLTENGHFDVVLRFAPQWRVHTYNDKWTADTEHQLSRQNTLI